MEISPEETTTPKSSAPKTSWSERIGLAHKPEDSPMKRRILKKITVDPAHLTDIHKPQRELEPEREPNIVIFNLPSDTTEDDVRSIAAVYGRVRRVTVRIKDPKIPGFAFVDFFRLSDARRAKEAIDGRGFAHMVLSTDWSKRKDDAYSAPNRSVARMMAMASASGMNGGLAVPRRSGGGYTIPSRRGGWGKAASRASTPRSNISLESDKEFPSLGDTIQKLDQEKEIKQEQIKAQVKAVKSHLTGTMDLDTSLAPLTPTPSPWRTREQSRRPTRNGSRASSRFASPRSSRAVSPASTTSRSTRMSTEDRMAGWRMNTKNTKTRNKTNRIPKITEAKYGDVLLGKVVKITHFGAFIDIGLHRDALCFKDGIRVDRAPVEDIKSEVSVGDVIEVRVASVRRDGKVKVVRFSDGTF